MHAKRLPLIIQGGMGIGVSSWQLARAVSTQGELGVVSGTGVNSTLVRRLQRGDSDGFLRRALAHFPNQVVAEEILKTYFVAGGIEEGKRLKLSPVPTVYPSLALQQLLVAASFVEVWLAKDGHDGMVGINFLEKLQTCNLLGIYGAMLAGVDVVLMGAGVPREIPGVLDRLADHQKVSLKISVKGADATTDLVTSFEPSVAFPDENTLTLKRPKFFPIVSSSTLATHLVNKSTGSVQGLVVESPFAGGHNAPPRGPMTLDERGEPVYGIKDKVDLDVIRDLGLPFWLAGSYGSPDRLNDALELGAAGIQVGTAFAFCADSGMSQHLRDQVLQRWASGGQHAVEPVFTDPMASPTGFPFKVVPLPDTLSESAVYEARPRKCDLSYLRQISVKADGTLVYLCPAEPVAEYVKKGGKVEDTFNRKCLCNALMANIGLAQTQERGYVEPPLLTAGDDLVLLGQFLQPNNLSYSAQEVIVYLKSKVRTELQG